MGRFDAHLGHIVDLQPAALVRGRLHTGLGIRQNAVEHTGGDTHGGLVIDIVDQLKQPAHPLSCQGGDKHNGSIGHETEIPADILPHTVHGLVVLLHRVPLVHHDDAGLSRLMGQTRHLGVLLGNAVVGVDHNETHIAALNGHGGPQNAVSLDIVVHLGLLPHTGGVDEVILALGVLKIAVDGVPGGAGHVADNDTLLTQNTVGQAGFPHVGLADDGHLDHVGLLVLVLLRWEIFQTLVQQIAGAVAMHGGDGHRVAEAQIIELVEIRIHRAGGVHLVDRQHDGLFAALKHTRHLLIGGGHAGFDIGDKNDHRGVVNGDLRLLPHEGQDLIIGAGLDTAGVHQTELAAQPLAFAVYTVTGHARRILHNAQASADQLIEQHGLPHIGPSHNRDQRFRHVYPSVSKMASSRSPPSAPTIRTGLPNSCDSRSTV